MLGDHSHDGRLTIGTPGYHEEVARWCAGRLADAAAIDLDRLSPESRVDALAARATEAGIRQP